MKKLLNGKGFKKVFAILMAVALVSAFIPMAFAADEDCTCDPKVEVTTYCGYATPELCPDHGTSATTTTTTTCEDCDDEQFFTEYVSNCDIEHCNKPSHWNAGWHGTDKDAEYNPEWARHDMKDTVHHHTLDCEEFRCEYNSGEHLKHKEMGTMAHEDHEVTVTDTVEHKHIEATTHTCPVIIPEDTTYIVTVKYWFLNADGGFDYIDTFDADVLNIDETTVFEDGDDYDATDYATGIKLFNGKKYEKVKNDTLEDTIDGANVVINVYYKLVIEDENTETYNVIIRYNYRTVGDETYNYAGGMDRLVAEDLKKDDTYDATSFAHNTIRIGNTTYTFVQDEPLNSVLTGTIVDGNVILDVYYEYQPTGGYNPPVVLRSNETPEVEVIVDEEIIVEDEEPALAEFVEPEVEAVEEEIIVDEIVPLADMAPQTGDTSTMTIAAIVALIALSGIVLVITTAKKREN